MNELVCILDQKQSRTSASSGLEEVLRWLASLRGMRKGRDYVQSLGDEVQIVVTPTKFPLIVDVSAKADCWLGVGVGPIERREASLLETTGTAFTLARDAVEQSKRRAWGACVIGSDRWSRRLDDALALYMTIVRGRSDEGWEAVELHERGLRSDQIAANLGVSPSAATKRLRSADYRAADRGKRLLKELATLAAREPDDA